MNTILSIKEFIILTRERQILQFFDSRSRPRLFFITLFATEFLAFATEFPARGRGMLILFLLAGILNHPGFYKRNFCGVTGVVVRSFEDKRKILHAPILHDFF